MTIRSLAYRFARMLGDANAIRRGPRAIAQRVERKLLWRLIARLVR